jgi:hypothetical protein
MSLNAFCHYHGCTAFLIKTSWTGDQPVASHYLHTGQHKHRINIHTVIHAPSVIRTHDPSVWAEEDSSCLRPRGHCDRLKYWQERRCSFRYDRGFTMIWCEHKYWQRPKLEIGCSDSPKEAIGWQINEWVVWERTSISILPPFILKLHGLSPRANYTDRATAASRRSGCQLLRIKGATWSAW